MVRTLSIQELLSQGVVQRAAGRSSSVSPAVSSFPCFGDLPSGLAMGVLHEWSLELGADLVTKQAGWPAPVVRGRANPYPWHPPLTLLAWHAARAWRQLCGVVIWIGQHVRPSPWLLSRVGIPASACIYVDVADHEVHAAHLWAVDQALRSPGVAAVIADASASDMPTSRRWQLAAAEGGCLALLARPPTESRLLSAAATRWRVRPEPTTATSPRWRIELTRCKPGALHGWHPGTPASSGGETQDAIAAINPDAPPHWTVEWVSAHDAMRLWHPRDHGQHGQDGRHAEEVQHDRHDRHDKPDRPRASTQATPTLGLRLAETLGSRPGTSQIKKVARAIA